MYLLALWLILIHTSTGEQVYFEFSSIFCLRDHACQCKTDNLFYTALTSGRHFISELKKRPLVNVTVCSKNIKVSFLNNYSGGVEGVTCRGGGDTPVEGRPASEMRRSGSSASMTSQGRGKREGRDTGVQGDTPVEGRPASEMRRSGSSASMTSQGRGKAEKIFLSPVSQPTLEKGADPKNFFFTF